MWVSHKIPEPLVKKKKKKKLWESNAQPLSSATEKERPRQRRVKFPTASQACLSRRPERKNLEEKVQESQVAMVQGDLERGGLVQAVHKPGQS